MTQEDAEQQSEHWQDLVDEKDAEIERLHAQLEQLERFTMKP